MQLGQTPKARALWAEYDALVADLGSPGIRTIHDLLRIDLALAEGDSRAAVKHARFALRAVRTSGSGQEIRALTELARALLADGHNAAAVRASRHAAKLHSAQALARSDTVRTEIWWWLFSALNASGSGEAAWAALQQAHALLLDGVSNVQDEGLRRSYLNKVEVNRDLVRTWLREASKRGLPDQQRLAHLAIQSNSGEPF